MTESEVRAGLAEIPDPEMPISIVDLGLVERVTLHEAAHGTKVEIDLLPTFVGCPALDMIERDVRTKIGAIDGVTSVAVVFHNDPAWTVDRITEKGRADLRAHGVTVPERGSRLLHEHGGTDVELRISAIACPFCGSRRTRVESPFGPTRCRMIYYCDGCRNSFEHMKRLE